MEATVEDLAGLAVVAVLVAALVAAEVDTVLVVVAVETGVEAVPGALSGGSVPERHSPEEHRVCDTH